MIFADIFTNFQNAVDAFTNAGYARAISSFLPVVTTLVGTYIVLYSWAGIRGQVQDWGNDMVARFIKISLIVGIGFTTAGYGQYVLEPVLAMPADLTSVVTGKSAEDVAGPAILDDQFDKCMELGKEAMTKGSLFSENGLVFYLTAITFYLSGIIITVYAAYLMLLSKGMLAILLSVGPLFIGCLIFDVTKRFFDSWVGMLVNYVMVYVFAVAAVSMTFVAFRNYLNVLTPESGIGAAVGLLVMALIDVLIIMGVTHMASSLAGGSPVGNGFGNWAVAAATGGASRFIGRGAAAGGRLAGRAAKKGVGQAAAAATRRFRTNSVRSA
ncbi:hypothetical protein AWV79_35745 [Cupriavidus sp. UYMMa02A]|nr:hypothetical protein AWV79_35745 [Cupriavidus sp. UYMMa02A]